MRASGGNPGKEGWPFEIRAFLLAGSATILALTTWSVVQVVLGSRSYRDAPSKALELALLSLVFYTPLVMTPIWALSWV